jgi:glycosyltransferase involved in cell wall biosynthesis
MLTDPPVVSIIIPTYQRPKMLMKAVESAIMQTYGNIKICIFDNASGDETEALVRLLIRKDDRIHYYKNETNIGAFDNFSKGFESVDTKYFCLLSDDDILLPNFIQNSINVFGENPDIGFVASRVLVVNEFGDMIGRRINILKAKLYHPPEGMLEIIHKGAPTWTGICFNKSAADDVGFIDKAIGAPSDYEFEYRLAHNYKFSIIEDFGAIFIKHSGSFSSQEEDIIERSESVLRIASKVKCYNNISDRTLFLAQKLLVKRYLRFIYKGIQHGYTHDKNICTKGLLSLEKNGFYKTALTYRVLMYSGSFPIIYLVVNLLKKGVIILKPGRGNKLEKIAKYSGYMRNLEVKCDLFYKKYQ